MRRPQREINIFNLSMLDVICSALGAFLILFLIASRMQNQSKTTAKSKEKQIQELQQQIIAQNMRPPPQPKPAPKHRPPPMKIKRPMGVVPGRKDPSAYGVPAPPAMMPPRPSPPMAPPPRPAPMNPPSPMKSPKVIGLCQVGIPTVRATLVDAASKDGDLVKVSLNGTVLRSRLNLDYRTTLTLQLNTGLNTLRIDALNVGSSSPNTARIDVNPCRNGAPRTFSYNMLTGDYRVITIARR